MKQYITISEFGETYRFSGEIRPELLEAVKDGIYSIIDITDPSQPLELNDEMEWIPVLELPVWDQ